MQFRAAFIFDVMYFREYYCINMIQTNLWNVCLSVILEFCLSSAIRGLLPAYTSLCRSLECLPKIRYIIPVDSNVTGSFSRLIFCLVDRIFLPRCLNKMCYFVNLLQFYSKFWNLIPFRLRNIFFYKTSENCLFY